MTIGKSRASAALVGALLASMLLACAYLPASKSSTSPTTGATSSPVASTGAVTTAQVTPTPLVGDQPAQSRIISPIKGWFDATDVTADGVAQPVDHYLSMSLTDYGSLSVDGYQCHYSNGTYSVADGKLVVNGLQAHLIGCGDVQDDYDWWFNELLVANPTVTADGDKLQLAGPGASVWFKPHAEAAAWIVDPAYSVDASTTDLHVLVLEGACASGKSPEGRILPADIDFTSYEIHITIWIKSLAEAGCPGNGPYPWVVTLPEPVGSRSIPGHGDSQMFH